MEELLERQWEQGSHFLMEQGQHFDSKWVFGTPMLGSFKVYNWFLTLLQLHV